MTLRLILTYYSFIFPSVYEWEHVTNENQRLRQRRPKIIINHCENSRCAGVTMTSRSRAKVKRSGSTLSRYSTLSLYAHTCAACVMTCKKRNTVPQHGCKSRLSTSSELFPARATLSRDRDVFSCGKNAKRIYTIFHDARREEILMIHV